MTKSMVRLSHQAETGKISMIIILALFLFEGHLSAQHISIKGNQFFTDSGKRIWLNGVNTPWNKWNDFGGNFDREWWNSHFEILKNNGINCTRIWISCNGDGAIKTDSTGVTGLSPTFFKDCDTLFAIASRNKVYIDATLISFDHFKEPNNGYMNWRHIVNDPHASQTFIDNYLLPFLSRYKSNPWFFAIDLCNEPEWVFENQECGRLEVKNLQRFFAMCSAAIHENSEIPVTIGSACIKWNSDNEGFEGNLWKDSELRNAFNHEKAFLDFYCVHYYAWVHKYFKSPFEISPADYGINDKPVIIEESPGKDSGLKEIPITVIESYEKALNLGYQGNLPWTSNGVDRNGDITTIGPATLSFSKNHRQLVYP